VPVLRHYRDLLPGEEGQAYLLDEWGRIFRWEEGLPLVFVYPEPIAQKDGRPDGSAAFRKDDLGGFVILTSDGDLHVRGKVAPWVSEIVESWMGEFPSAVDFEMDPKTQTIMIASSHGQVVRVSAGGRDLIRVLDTTWEEDVIKSMVVTPNGISLYDHLGGIHGPAVPEEIRKRSVYIPEPLMTDLWASTRGDGAAALRVDGTVFLWGDADPGLWDRRFLPWAATGSVTTYEALA
jgi:hypothetical protein